MKKCVYILRLIIIYIVAMIIGTIKYDMDMFADSKYFRGGGKWKKFTGIGWRWILEDYYGCKKLHVNQDVRFPVSPRIKIAHPENIVFDSDDIVNFQGFGNYYQAFGKIVIGSGSYIAPNVGLITANHDVNNLEEHSEAKEIHIGKNCWIGMNSMILPGVILGDKTIVGAGSVVTKSFPLGNCVIGGNPAKIIKYLSE